MLGGWFKRYLERLAKVNEEQFGREALDCCKLNAKQNGTGHDPDKPPDDPQVNRDRV